MKESGILMPVSALPSRTGIGELGAQTREFLKLLRENKVTIWQVLNSHQSDINWCDRRDYGIPEDRG